MKNKIITVSFILYIFTFSILGIIFKDNEISFTERRKLKTFPEFELTNKYINKVDKYFLDHFPYRDSFRSIKARFNYNILNKLDNNDIYLKDNYIYKSEFPTSKKSLDYFIKNINKTKDKFKNSNFYMMVIPDKNYYLEDSDFLHIDYDYIYENINNIDLKHIDIRDIMNSSDYYETDTHWKQENLEKVVSKLNEVMKFNYKKEEYQNKVYDNFYGVYYGESAIKRKPEKLTYLTNDKLDNIYVKYLENPDLHKLYNVNKLDTMDSYQVYLDGASSFIEIYNLATDSNKELVVFRDSFGSSLLPLLSLYYKKITVIDNRYINSNNYLNLFEVNNQDVLFLYSTLVVNNSYTLKG